MPQPGTGELGFYELWAFLLEDVSVSVNHATLI